MVQHIRGGTYNWSLNQANSVNFAGLGNLKIGRIDITPGNSNSPVDNGTGAFVTDDAHRITITWDQGRPIADSIIPGKTWNSAGSNIPDKVTQNIWYVDAQTGKVLSHKVSDEAFNGSSYDSTSNELPTITKDGKTYQLVDRASDGLYNSSDFTDILNKQLTTNNGVSITVGDLLSTPLKGILGDGRIGNIRASITNYQGTRAYTRLQTKTDGTIDLNTYLFDAGSPKGALIPGLSQANVAPGQTVMGAHLADTGSGAFYNGTKPGNRDIIILYKDATPVANKQNANITFVNDDTGASLSPQQNTSGDAGSQISFDNAASTVNNLINQGYVYNGTTGTGVTNGAASGSFTSISFPVYDNDDNTNQAFVVHFKNPAQTTTYHQGVEESKTIQRTINYYDKVTGARIPSRLIAPNPITDSVTFTRTQVLDQNGKVVGYGTVGSDGKSFRTQDWHTAEGLTTDEFAAKKSADLSAFNYTAPEFQDGTSANVVAAHKVTPDTQNLEYNVYYGHQTQQVTTNQDVTRRFHYIFTDGTTPESHLTPQADQKVTFTGTATKDLVTGKTGDTVWTPATGTLAQVAGQQVAGYHITGNINANADGSANAVTVNPTSGDIDVTIVYTPDAKTPDTPQKAKVTIYDKTENNRQLSAFENNNGTKGSAISFDGEPQTLQAYLNSGYVFDSATDANGNSIGTASNITFGNFDSVDGNVQSFNIYLVHGTDTKTESATTNAHVHYVVAGNEANKPAAPADSPVQTINWTRTNTTDKVTGATTEGTWTPDKNGFTSVTSPTLTNYTPDQAVANFTTPQPNHDQVVTVVYNPNPEVAQKADLVIYDKTDNNKELNSFDNSGKTGTQISFSGSANYVADLITKGYKIDSFVNDQNQTSNPTSYGQINFSNFDNNSASDQHFKLYLVHDTENVTDKKTTTSTVRYVVSDGKTNPPSDNTQTITWTRPGTKDKVTGVTTPTGNWTTPDNYTDVPTPNLDGYTPDKTNVPAPTPDPNQNPTTVVTYNPKTPDAPTYTGTTETKTVTRTINYYDRVTGEKIPTNLIAGNPTTQNVTLSRTHVVSSTGQDMGYGTVSADGKTFTKAATADGWNTGDWDQVTSPDLSNAGYTTPDLAQADHVTVNSATKDAVVNVYYGHQTEVITPKTPHNPGGNINPNDPRNNPSVYPDGLTKEALTTEVTRHINYVGVNEDGTTTPVNGAPDGKSTYTQTVSFERNAVIDKVTGQILGYSTDGTTNVTTTDKERAWTPTTQNMDSVASKTPSEVGYDKVDISTVGGVTVYPGQKVNDVTVTYTKNKTPEVTQKATLEIIDNNNANSPKQLALFSNEGKSEDQINFANSNEILQSYLSQGYKVQKTAGNLSGDAQSGYTYPTYGNTAQDFKIYLIHDTEDKTETATATAQVHYVVADNGVQAPKDSELQTITYTRTNKVDKVTGAVVNEGEWKTDKNAFTDVTSPDLSKDGYTPSLENVQFNAPERNVNQRVTVVYNRSAQAADLQIIDDNDPQNQRVLATYSAGGESGKQISFDGSNTQLQNYLNHGYTFEKYEGQGMSGDAQNGFTYPSFDNDSQSNQSFKIYLKHATGNKTETATTTAHVHYIMADGTKAPNDSATQTINWTRTNTVDQVTGAIVNEGTWTADKNAFTDVESPAVAGYTPGTKTVKFATPERGVNQVVNVVYTKDAPTPEQQNALVVYQDVNDPAHPVDLGQSDQLTGQAGDAINYSTADKIAEYKKQGYVLVSNGFDANGTKPSFDNVNGNTQTFYVTFKHGIQPVTPTTPGTPDQPINPDNPDGPKYPSGTDQTSLTKDVTRTVTYEGAGDQTPSPVTDTLHFQGTGYLDKVTGKWTDANGNELADQAKGITWTITDGTKDEGSFNLVPTKHIDGYTSQVVTDGANDGNGNVKSYTGITHASDNINVVVRYNPIVAEQGNLIVKFHDDTDNKDLTGVGTDTGTQDVGTQVTYNPSTDLTNLENKGYVYVSTDGNIPSSIVKGTTTVTIHVKHGTVPVTPDNPGTPDKPINPSDPDGPKYPSGTDKASIDKTITRTVHYEDADQYTPNDVQQPVHFTAKGELDKVTGEWTAPLTWSADQTFNGVTTPKIPGYHVVSVDRDANGNDVASTTIAHTGSDYTVNVVYAKDDVPTPKTQQNAQLIIRDVTPGQEQDLGSYTQPGLEGDAISFGSAQEFVQNLLNKGYVWDGASYNGANLNATNYAGINFGNYDNTDDKNGISQKWVINLVHGVTPVNPDHPDDKDGYTKEYLDRTITRDVTYVDEQGNAMPGLTPEHQEAKFQGSGYLDNVTGKWVNVENGKITGLADGLTWTPDTDANFAAIAAKTADGYHVISVSGNGISGFTVDANGAVTAQTVNRDTASSTIKVVYAKTPEVPVPANGSIIYIDDTTGNRLENATFGGNVGQKINYTTADRIANYEGRGYKLVSNNFKDGNESFTNGENKFEVHLTHDTTTKDVTKTVTRDVTYVYKDGSQADTPVNQSFTFNGKTVTDRVTGAETTSWDTDDHNFDATKSIDTTNYQIIGISKTNTTANVDSANGVVASETITPTSQNSSVVITLAKKVTPPTPVKQGAIEVIYHDTTDNVDIPGYGQPQTKEDQGTAFNYNPNAKDLPALENKGYVLDGELPTIPTEYTDGNQRVVINVKHGTRPVTPENPANPTDPVDPQHPQTPTPSNPNLSKTDLEKTITRTIQYQYTDGTKAPADVVQTVNFTGEGTIDLVTGNLVTVDKDGNILNQRGKITWNHDSQDFANVAAINHDGYYVSNVSENGTTAKVDGTAVAGETVTPTSQNSTIVITLTKNPEVPVAANGSITYIDDTTGNVLASATFGGNVGQKINYTTADKIANYVSQGYNLVSNNFNDGNETVAKDGNVFEVHLVHATTPITPENPGKPGQEVPNPNDPEHPHKIPANFVPQTLTNTVMRDVTYVYEDGSQAEAPVHQTFTFTGNGVVDLVTGQLVTVENGKITGAGHITWNAENHDFDATKAIDTTQYNIVKVSENNTTANVDMNNGVVAGETITPTSQNSSVVITLAKKPVTPTPVQKGTVIVNYVDKTTGKTLETATSTGNEGSNVNYSTKDTITKYTNQGYELEHDGYPTGTVTYTNGTVTYEVDLVHGTVPVNPDQPGPKTPNTPINPDNPDGPKYPDGTQPEQLTKTITRTINYVGDGLNIPSVEKSLTFVANGVLDKVTGQWVTVDKDGKITGNANGMTWTVKDGNADEGSFDEVAGPQTEGYHITNISASNEDLSDINSSTGTVAGKTINHTNGNIVITINYAKNPVTPTPTPADQTVVGKQIVHYVDGDNNNAKLLDDNTNDTFVFTKSGETGTWNADSHKYANANAPVIDGYVAEQKTYEGQTATPGDANKEITIVYHKIGKIIPVDPSGNPIPDAPTPSYHNDPTDPTKVTPNEPTPTVPGWTTNVPNVTPDTPTGDTKVPYTKPTPTQDKGSITITVHDVTDNTDLPEYGKTSGSQNVGTEFSYDKTGTFTSLTNKGYKIVNPDVTIPTGITKGDQNIVIYVEHTTTPITPENPGKPGQPINPNDPTGPQYPDGSDQVTKDVTRTITYVDNNGNKLHDSVEQTAHFTGTGVIDNVTGKWVTPITWNGNGDLSGQNTPVIDGYHVTSVSRDGDGNNVAKVTVNHGDSDYTVVVTYTPNGKIVPVDPSGNPIPDAPTPQYPTDPSNPAKVIPDEPVPSIPGFTPEVPTVTPTNPGEDTPVVYTPDTPVTPVTVQGKVTYVDDTTGQTISTDNFSGKVGDKITYTTADKISELEGQGYELVSNNFKDGNETFTNGENSFVVHLKHIETIVTPENPHDSGEESYTTQKTTTFTVHYVGAGDKTPSDRVETIQWHRQVTVDSVTGNVISTTPWTTDGSYTGANTPVIDGFHADKAAVNAPQADPDKDVVETVTYAPNGHIIPVDKNGTPIPGADQPVYPTDPTDPTKVVPNEPVPTVPGYTPERETVTPVDPGTDTPVVYDRGNTPVTPETPTTTPTTPGDDTPSNETPVTPEVPVDNGGEEGNDEVTPTPQTPESPAANGSVNPAAPQPTAAKQTNAQQPAATTKAEAKKLPQTGNADANSAEILGLAALGLTGLVGLGKKRRKED